MSDGLLKCLSCAAVLQPDDSKKYLECEYCGTHNANFSKFEVLDLKVVDDGSEDLSDLEKLAVHLKHRHYDILKEDATLFLKTHPYSWIAMVYKAIGEFWTGHNDFSHLDDVMELLNKAMSISKKNEFVINAFDRVANNCLIICAKHKKPYGNDLKQSLIIFNYFYSDSIDETNKALVLDYCSKAYKKYKKDLGELSASSDKKMGYDPPYNAVDNLYYLAKISDSTEIQQFFYIQASHHIARNQSKSYIKELEKKFNKIKSALISKDVKLEEIKIKTVNPIQPGEGCFVATAVYGNYEHPIVLDFRRFRDEYLMNNKYGLIFVRVYYKHGPLLAKFINKNRGFKLLTRWFILKPLHMIIKKGGQ